MILQQKENADIVAREGDNVTLACDAKGHPRPQVVWRREDKEDILVNGRKGSSREKSMESCVIWLSRKFSRSLVSQSFFFDLETI